MHIGNVYAALMSYLHAKKQGGAWLLRIEDLDAQRCKREYADALLSDLRWIGLTWDEGPEKQATESFFQSERTAFYEAALTTLKSKATLYDCFCSRADIFAASAPHASDGTIVYSGKCKTLSQEARASLLATRKPATRIAVPDSESSFIDGHYGLQRENLLKDTGDFIVQRADKNFAYQLAVTVDDALMGVTDVARGRDLLASTHQQLFLYHLLGYTPPAFFHLPLLVAPDGRRLAKRHGGSSMKELRECYSPQQLIGLIMHLCGFIPKAEAVSLSEALALFEPDALPTKDIVVPTDRLDIAQL